MKYEIMLKILFELLSKKSVKASYLADKFEVSIRSIHRYINCLELAGVPLYTTRGINGGISIVDTYRLSSTFMTEKEFQQTINALAAITESVPNKILDSAIIKLKSAVKNECSGLSLSAGNLVIDAGPWGDTVGYKSKLIILQKSIEDSKKLLIKYHNRNGDITERTIHPHVIVFKQGLWYIFAFCELRKEFRLFKTGRIEQATILNENFIRQDISKMDLPFDFWNINSNTVCVKMEINKKYLSDVEEWLGIENITYKDNKHIANVKLPLENGLVSKIMSYGSGIKVLEPEELKLQIKKQAQQIVESY